MYIVNVRSPWPMHIVFSKAQNLCAIQCNILFCNIQPTRNNTMNDVTSKLWVQNSMFANHDLVVFIYHSVCLKAHFLCGFGKGGTSSSLFTRWMLNMILLQCLCFIWPSKTLQDITANVLHLLCFRPLEVAVNTIFSCFFTDMTSILVTRLGKSACLDELLCFFNDWKSVKLIETIVS